MNMNFDFEQYTPPRLNEENLMLLDEKRKEIRRMLLLAASSHLLFLSLVLAAFLIAPYSLVLSLICLTVLGLWLSGTGIIAVVFTRKLLQSS